MEWFGSLTRNWQPEYVHSKPCFGKGCGKIIFWNDLKHYYSDGPNSDSPKHQCAGSTPKTTKKPDNISLEKIFSELKILETKIDRLLEQRIEPARG